MIDATDKWVPMRRSLGDKRREISTENIAEISGIHQGFEDGEHSKIFDTSYFGFRKITVERPLRLNFQASAERVESLKDERAFQNLAISKKRNDEAKALEEEAGREQQKAIKDVLNTLPEDLFTSRLEFERVLNACVKERGVKLSAPLKKAITSALSERDESAEICVDSKGNPEPDTDLRDTENVPLGGSVHDYFNREVMPHVPDAWISDVVRDAKDGELGRIGYEINFNRYFYQYTPPRPLEEIEAEIKVLEREIMDMLREVAG